MAPLKRRVATLAVAALAGAAALAACSAVSVTPSAAGGEEAASGIGSDTAGARATTAAPVVTTTTVPPTTAAPTATTEPLITAPFTGVPTPAEIVRPAAVVKIDNHPRALPQWGLNQADVVYEELVEARLTRFAAIFHSQEADLVGPVRSARTGDFALLSNLNRPIFVNSGANSYTLRALRNVNTVAVVDGGTLDRDVLVRSSDKHPPHNLVTGTDRIYGVGGNDGGTPPSYLNFRSAAEPMERGFPVRGVDVDFGEIEASYRWNPALGGWARSQNGAQHTDFDGVRIAPENVIVQFVRYRQSPADAATPEPVLTGGGEAWIFTAGRLLRGTWTRLSELDVTVFRAENALEVPLTPGRTWIALALANTATIVR